MGLFRRNKGNSNTQEAVQEGAFIVEALKTDTEEKTPHELNDSGENVLDESFEPYRKVGDAPHARTSYKGELAYTKSSWMARHAYEDENKLHQVQQENDELKSQVKTLTTQTSFRRRVLLALVSLIVTSAAVGVLISTFAFPVLRVVGTSMYPTLTTDDMIVVNKAAKVKRGDIVACYLNNRIILKRAIAFQGENVVIDADGNVIVNGQLLEEPYVSYLALGNNDISYPYQVPEGQIFVLGDHRSTSEDSRSTTVGCMPDDKILGKVIFRMWPIVAFGPISGASYDSILDKVDTQPASDGSPDGSPDDGGDAPGTADTADAADGGE